MCEGGRERGRVGGERSGGGRGCCERVGRGCHGCGCEFGGWGGVERDYEKDVGQGFEVSG